MTNEEHIKKLKDILSEATETEDAVCYVTSEDKETLEAAISALSQPQIPVDATNGDVITVLFDHADIIEDLYSVGIVIKGNDNRVTWFNEKWWNSPYKGKK